MQTKISPYGFSMQGDLELLHTLLRDNSLYNIPSHARAAVITDCTAVLNDPGATVATRLSASKVLLECDKRNIDMVKMVVPKQIVHRTVSEMSTEELAEAMDEYQRVKNGLPERVNCTPINSKSISPMKRTY